MPLKKQGGKLRAGLLLGIGLSAGLFVANITPAPTRAPNAFGSTQGLLSAPTSKPVEPKSWWAPDKVTVAGMQYPVRGGASLAFLLAALGVSYLPAAKRLFSREPSQTPSIESESTAVSESESTAVAGVQLNIENNNQQVRHDGADPVDLARMAWSKALVLGGRNALSTVMSDHVDSYISEGEGLALAFSEEQHAVKYRKSKNDLLSAFCERLKSDAREDWFRLACTQHGDLFERIQVTIKSTHRKLNQQRRLLLSAVKDYESLQDSKCPIKQIEFEKRFKSIYDTVIEDLSGFIEELMKLDSQCLVQRSAEHTFQYFVDEIKAATKKGGERMTFTDDLPAAHLMDLAEDGFSGFVLEDLLETADELLERVEYHSDTDFFVIIEVICQAHNNAIAKVGRCNCEDTLLALEASFQKFDRLLKNRADQTDDTGQKETLHEYLGHTEKRIGVAQSMRARLQEKACRIASDTRATIHTTHNSTRPR